MSVPRGASTVRDFHGLDKSYPDSKILAQLVWSVYNYDGLVPF